MYGLIIFLAALFIGISLLAATLTLRYDHRHRRLSWILAGGLWFMIGAGLLLFLLDKIAYQATSLIWATVVFLGIGLVFWLVLAFGERHHQGDPRTLRDRIVFAGRVALPGWKKLDTSELKGEEKKETSELSSLLVIGISLVVVPGVIGILAAAIVMNVKGSDRLDLLSHAVGFFALLVATCWTVCYILTITLVSVTQVIRGNGRQLSLSRVAISLGTWAGLGAAGGVFVGALVPLVVIPLLKGNWRFLGIDILDSISPSLLLDISAAGAVFGFLIGEVISLIDIASGEDNLYLKVVMPPFVFATLVSVLGAVGLSPGSLSRSLAIAYKSVLGAEASGPASTIFSKAAETGLETKEGWALAVAGMEASGWNATVDHQIFYGATWIVAILVVLFSLTLQIRGREIKLLESKRHLKG